MSTALLPVAQAMTAAGLSVIPIGSLVKKAPAGRLLPMRGSDPSDTTWDPFKVRIASGDELRTWFGPAEGVAVVGGSVSHGLTILDIDVKHAPRGFVADVEELIEITVPGLLERLPAVDSPSGGRHIYFRCSVCEGSAKLAERGRNETLIETKAEGGYCLAPVTTGYQTVRGTLRDVPVIEPWERSALLAAARSFDQRVATTGPHLDAGDLPGAAFNARMDLDAMQRMLEEAGWRLVHTKHDGTRLLRRPGKTEGWSATLGRGGTRNLHVFSVNASPFEANENYGAFAILAQLRYGGEYGAAASALARDGYGGRRARHSTEPLAAVPDVVRASNAPIFVEIGADDLDRMTFPPVYFPVPGILPEGATLFAAPPKTGKSTTMLGLSVALASGGRALGMIPVEPARVLYLALEEPPRLTQKRLRMMVGQGRLPALLRMVYEGKPLDELPKAIEAYVAQYPDTKMVVVDTLAHARGAGSRARKDIQQEDYQELIPFSHLAQKLHIAIVLVTHTKKGEALDELEMVAGSYGLAGAVDNILILNRKRHESDATLSVFSRELGSEQKLALHWDPQTLSYILDGVAADVKTSKETDEVVLLLRSAQGVMATRDVAAALGLNISTATMRLRKALEAGLIVMAGYGKYTVPAVYAEKTPESAESVESTLERPVNFQSGVRGVTPEGRDSPFESSPDPSDPTFNGIEADSTGVEGPHQRGFNTFSTFSGFSEPPAELYAFDGRPAAACRCGRRMWTTPRYETDAVWCCSNCGVEWRAPTEPIAEEPL